MEEINEIVKSIVKGCAKAGIEVSDVLAAFVARTIVEKHETTFILDRKLTPESVQEVITQH